MSEEEFDWEEVMPFLMQSYLEKDRPRGETLIYTPLLSLHDAAYHLDFDFIAALRMVVSAYFANRLPESAVEKLLNASFRNFDIREIANLWLEHPYFKDDRFEQDSDFIRFVNILKLTNLADDWIRTFGESEEDEERLRSLFEIGLFAMQNLMLISAKIDVTDEILKEHRSAMGKKSKKPGFADVAIRYAISKGYKTGGPVYDYFCTEPVIPHGDSEIRVNLIGDAEGKPIKFRFTDSNTGKVSHLAHKSLNARVSQVKKNLKN